MNKLFFLVLSCIVTQGSVDAMDKYAAKYPFHDAASKNDVCKIEALLLSGYPVNQYDHDAVYDLGSITVLQRAAEKVVQKLLNFY